MQALLFLFALFFLVQLFYICTFLLLLFFVKSAVKSECNSRQSTNILSASYRFSAKYSIADLTM
jgi:hypothetical protein